MRRLAGYSKSCLHCQRAFPTPVTRFVPVSADCWRFPMSVKFIAALALAASFCLAPSSASAGLFRNAGCGCDVAPSCGCEVAPSCGCEIACDPCDPCACRGGKLRGMLSKLHSRKACCEPCAPVCCEPAPVCCAPAPVCCEPAPVCCDPCDPCCDRGPGLLAKLRARLAARKCCCDAAPSCGCEVAPSCGCELSCCGN